VADPVRALYSVKLLMTGMTGMPDRHMLMSPCHITCRASFEPHGNSLLAPAACRCRMSYDRVSCVIDSRLGGCWVLKYTHDHVLSAQVPQGHPAAAQRGGLRRVCAAVRRPRRAQRRHVLQRGRHAAAAPEGGSGDRKRAPVMNDHSSGPGRLRPGLMQLPLAALGIGVACGAPECIAA